MNNVKILDCTLRDGGLGLEDAFKNQISVTTFDKIDYLNMIDNLKKSKIDIIELGSIEISDDDKTGYGIFQSIEDVSRMIPEQRVEGQMYVALYRGPDTPIEDIPEWNQSLVDGVRVIIRYSELKKSLDFCSALSEKGYKVFVQPMLTMRYTDEELDLIIRESNKMNAFAVYFVDSYGYMNFEDVNRLYNFYNEKLNPNIKIGFHAHNNMNMAYANAIELTRIANGRDIIIDSCAIGMGQGAGNLQTELIVSYLDDESKYDFNEILALCEIIEKYTDVPAWGYSVTRMLPAIHKTAYKYSIVYRNKFKLSYVQINAIMKKMTPFDRMRYTLENAEKYLED